MRQYRIYDDATWEYLGTAEVRPDHAEAFVEAGEAQGFLLEEVTA